MSEISIILIRHGEASAAWGDDPDPGLSERGISQASKLTTIKDLDQLDGYDFISSPKSRAVMTATPLIKKYNKNLKIDNEDYYYSNVVARASKTMSECKTSKAKFKSTGTEG